jgi:uncharacterized protein (TIGR03435 family)
MTNISAREMIKFAYGATDSELSGGPGWIELDRYDIEATVKQHGPSPLNDQLRRMVESLLVDRFQLKLNHHRSHAPIYTLERLDGGATLTSPIPLLTFDSNPSKLSQGASKAAQISDKDGTVQLTMTASSVGNLADLLSVRLAAQVLDRTGYTGRYDLTLHWSTETVLSEPSLFTALQEQLGLKLELHESPILSFAVEKIEKPS